MMMLAAALLAASASVLLVSTFSTEFNSHVEAEIDDSLGRSAAA